MVTANGRVPLTVSSSRPRHGLLEQSFGLQRLDDVRAGADTLDVALQLRPLPAVDVHVTPPAENREQVGIRDGERLAGEKRAVADAAIQIVESHSEGPARILLHFLVRIVAEQRRKVLVD